IWRRAEGSFAPSGSTKQLLIAWDADALQRVGGPETHAFRAEAFAEAMRKPSNPSRRATPMAHRGLYHLATSGGFISYRSRPACSGDDDRDGDPAHSTRTRVAVRFAVPGRVLPE